MLKKYYLSLIIILSTFFCCTKLDDFTINTQALNLTINSILVDSNTANFTIQINNPGKFNLVKQGFYYDTNDININTSPKIDITTNTLKLTALVYGKKYNVRSFIQAKGTNEPIYYGTDNTFYIPYKIPIIASTNVLNITKNTAAINFSFINYNNVKIDTAGIAYSNSINLPTIQNNIVLLPNKGILTGNYAANLSNLTANTTYYVRVFFYYNGTIYYGSVQNFTTTNLPSTLTLANLDSNMVSVPAGSFTMGATNEQLANNGDGFTVNWSPTTQQVSLSSYKICRFEVTQQLWLDVMGSNPSFFNGGSYGTNLQRPIENVSWDNCQTFIAKLKQLTNKNYRLPTEAEWEYAARGGANTTYNFIYSGSNNLNDVAWYGYPNNGNSGLIPHTIGTKQANALGLYDMSGNIWEWCNDWSGNYSNTAVTNPQGPASGIKRVIRGSSWFSGNYECRNSWRRDYMSEPNNGIGFRLVLDSTILPTITTNAVTSITNTTATANINISNPNGLNITATGVAYSSSNSTPTTTDAYIAHSSTGNLAGNYTLELSSLTANTRYYVRAYINYNGTIYYGNVQNFTTLQTAPTITTNAVTSITNTAATANINISNPNGLNITVAGVAYSSSNSTPTTADAYIAHNSTGNLAGNYTLALSSLTANTTYYVRGYINYNGTIYYGNVQNFTTTNLPTTLNLANLETNMVTVPAGSFTMGVTSEQLANNGDGFSVFWSPTTQQVTLSTYKICRFEVTQQLWQDVMGSNPSYFTGNLQRPVEQVRWSDCQTFINRLNQLTGKTYRLPTEAEWEYAARGGANSTYSYIYSGGNTLNDVAWNGNNSNSQTQTVGTKQANALGLYDMSGNVWEWCNDWYGDYSNTGVTNPQGPATGSYRVIRGGSWSDRSSGNYRVSFRDNDIPGYSNIDIGLRLVLDNTTIPTITTNAVTSITNTTATANINISNPNGLNITAAGVAYSSSNSTPTTADAYIAHNSTGNLSGNYTLGLSSLTANTRYYVRGYINFNGTIYYGAVQNFTTTILASVASLESNMVTVPAGSFTMGATSEQLANNADGFYVFWSPTTQQVSLSSYKICRFEVTQQLWQDVMGSNPSSFTGNLQRPVESVSWDACQTFITRLNQLTGKNYRLPTEAEWEYAARGGANSTYSYIYSGGNTLNDVAWNGYNSNSQTQTVGTKQANALGLYDMSGNVLEWCNDWYGNYSSTAVTNPQGPATGSYRVIRGGGWGFRGDYNRVSFRSNTIPGTSYDYSGIRLVFSSN